MQNSYEFMKILSIEEAKKITTGKKVVVITGVTGQDGSFMADYLLANTDYEIFGGARRLSVSNHENVAHLQENPRFHLINFDLTDAHSISQLVSQLQPIYFINFAAQSFVKSSWDFPAQTWETNTTSMIHILEAIRLHCPNCRFYNAGSSEEFGDVIYAPQDENHPMRPRSPYGASKAASRQLVKVYRESYNLYAIQGWLFNHEGTRRGEDFVTRKISKNVARIRKAFVNNEEFDPMELGNMDARRDWTDAEDCVIAVWKMLNQEMFDPSLQYLGRTDCVKHLREYVVATGENHTIKEFVEEAFKVAGINGKWTGDGINLQFVHDKDILVRINSNFYRPAEVENLLGNPAQIKHRLGWRPKTTFKELVAKMVEKDIAESK